uniref:Uncharacterized protein n=1 Tax=Ixodes ricinus TaxID=34613 RepID=A0A6B0V369_IXORI
MCRLLSFCCCCSYICRRAKCTLATNYAFGSGGKVSKLAGSRLSISRVDENARARCTIGLRGRLLGAGRGSACVGAGLGRLPLEFTRRRRLVQLLEVWEKGHEETSRHAGIPRFLIEAMSRCRLLLTTASWASMVSFTKSGCSSSSRLSPETETFSSSVRPLEPLRLLERRLRLRGFAGASRCQESSATSATKKKLVEMPMRAEQSGQLYSRYLRPVKSA